MVTVQLLECSRNATGPERRHLCVMDSRVPLCGAQARQAGAGAGTWHSLLAWPNCRPCKRLAKAQGPHPKQVDA